MILIGLKCRAGFLLRILWCCQSGGSFRKYFSQIWLPTRFHGSRNQKNHSIFLATYWHLYIKIGGLGKKKQHFIFQNACHNFFLSSFLPSFHLPLCLWSVRQQNRLREPAFPCVSRFPNQRGASVLMAV